jgi:hypothetical protein
VVAVIIVAVVVAIGEAAVHGATAGTAVIAIAAGRCSITNEISDAAGGDSCRLFS